MKINYTNLLVLSIVIITDYMTALILAGVFHKSPKTPNGCLNSSVGYKGIIKKAMLYCVVGIGYILNYLTKTTYIGDTVIFTCIVNEIISIIENLYYMGVPMPKIIINTINKIKDKDDDND